MLVSAVSLLLWLDPSRGLLFEKYLFYNLLKALSYNLF